MKMDGMKNMGALSQFTNKRKLMGVVFIIALLVLLWQVSGLLGTSTYSVTSKADVSKEASASALQSSVKRGRMADQKRSHYFSKLVDQSKTRATEYTQAVNTIELLKLKAKESALNQKIIEAKLKEIEAQKAIEDLTTVKAKPVISVSQYAETLANKRVDLPATKSKRADATAKNSPVAQNFAVNLRLLFISNQAGKMTAIIGVSGVLYEVQEGSSLPGGWKIQGINPQKVYVVNSAGKTQTLTLTPVI